jgi:hypothetical protein
MPTSNTASSGSSRVAAQVGGPRIEILGTCSVDGIPVRTVRAIEFVTALAIAGGRMRREALRDRVYERDVADSTLPTLAYRARRLGLDVRYERDRRQFRLVATPEIDALVVLDLIGAGRIDEALGRYGGPCLPTSCSPLAEALRFSIESRLAAGVARTGDHALIERAARRIDCWSLAEHAMRGPDGAAAVLGRSYLQSSGLLPEA